MSNSKCPKIKITKNGPYCVSGKVPLAKEYIVGKPGEEPDRWEKGSEFPTAETVVLCRCGRSSRPPFCDGRHAEAGFDGTETAPRKKFSEMAETYSGPTLELEDVLPYCARAHFCMRAGDAWTLTEESDRPESRKLAIQESELCPSGRLVARDAATGEFFEPNLQPAIAVVEDRYSQVSGPLWIKGGIAIVSADGHEYEPRNRVTLCRCGRSRNKPFCDGAHIACGFHDGGETLGKDQ